MAIVVATTTATVVVAAEKVLVVGQTAAASAKCCSRVLGAYVAVAMVAVVVWNGRACRQESYHTLGARASSLAT